MSRRHLTYFALVVASFVFAACADVTAPRGDVAPDSTGTCAKGFVMVGGRCVPQ